MAVLTVFNVAYRKSSGQSKHDTQYALVAVANTSEDQAVIGNTIKTNLYGGGMAVTIISATKVLTGVQY
jgi:hypothetical protein